MRQAHRQRPTTPTTGTRPKLREICIGLEINAYLPAEL